jgi:hypothetical protein
VNTVNARTLHNIFQPDSQGTARYGLVPWSRVEIIIGGVAGSSPDRSQGVVIPEIEGEGLIVERADWPVLLAPVVGQGNTDVSLVAARDGLEFDSPFKGLLVAHPILTTLFAPQTMKLSLIVFRVKGALRNQLAEPFCRAQLQYRAITNTAVNQAIGIFIPPGVRQLDELQIGFAFTTMTSAVAQLNDSGLNLLAAPSVSQQMAAGIATYNAGNANAQIPALVSSGVAAIGLLTFQPWPMPSFAREINVSWNGTGLGQPTTVMGRWS